MTSRLMVLMAVSIGAALFVFWLFGRRKRPVLARMEDSLPQGNNAPEKVISAELEPFEYSSVLQKIQTESITVAAVKPAIERAAVAEVNTVESTSDEGGPRLSDEGILASNDTACEAGPEVGSGEQFLRIGSQESVFLASNENSLEPDVPEISLGIADIVAARASQFPEPFAVIGKLTIEDTLAAERVIPEDDPDEGAAEFVRDVSTTEAGTNGAQPTGELEESIAQEAESPGWRYRPPTQKPQRPAAARPENAKTKRAEPSELRLEIRVCLRFDRSGGFCEIGLLPERAPELEDEVEVKSGGTTLRLVGEEDWYQEIRPQNIGESLRHGLELKTKFGDQRRARWLLSGRDIYVIASHPRVSYRVSTSRLALSRSHVVLCVPEKLQQVEDILNEAGCQGYTKLDESHGVPAGWVGLNGVLPTKAIQLEAGTDPLYAIKPAPDIEIELEGGVRLRNQVWLAGYPPRINLFGQVTSSVKFLIDDKEAHQTEGGSFLVDGYDLPGQHFAYCEGLSCSRSYSIEEPPDSWLAWPAYQYGQVDICGPLVRPAPRATRRNAVTVPMSNPILLGAEPGQIFRCSTRSVQRWKGYVPFDVVWALPALPLICNKKTARILQFANAPCIFSRDHRQQSLGWCNAILDASRKGLQIEGEFPNSADQWREYKKVARVIWRSKR
jgi:hypothetical protein